MARAKRSAPSATPAPPPAPRTHYLHLTHEPAPERLPRSNPGAALLRNTGLTWNQLSQPRRNALDPGFQCVRPAWIRVSFMGVRDGPAHLHREGLVDRA